MSTFDRTTQLQRSTLGRALLAMSVLALLAIGVLTQRAAAQGTQGNTSNRFANVIGTVAVGEVKTPGNVVQVPFITWGGDVPTFVANGGLTTTPGSTFAQQGLNLSLVNGDDFAAQVRRYLSGESPFLRGELRMLALASEVISSDPRTKPVVFLQLTWSAGDHMIGRAEIKSLNDIKGKTIALQRNGPHVGMLDDILRATKLTWSDVKIVWAESLTGDKGPANLFRNNPNIDACFVISPDMIGLTGGLDSRGSGAEGTVKDARVVVSTAQMSRAIADVYAVRKDFYDKNKATVEKFVAGYLKATERVVSLRNDFAKTGKNDEYMNILRLAQNILGKDVLPTLEVDAHGLLLDATFVGLPGNQGWFRDAGNLDGFDAKQRTALDLAVGQGYAGVRAAMIPHDLDYAKIAQLGGLAVVKSADTEGRFKAEAVEGFGLENIDDKTILSFTINFEPNQEKFDPEIYGPEFLRALQAASTFGSAVVAVRGHADPTQVLRAFVKAGMERGVITRVGAAPNFKYFLRGQPLDIAKTADLVKLINDGTVDGAKDANPRETVQAALNLSRARAEAVRDEILKFATSKGVRLDRSQIQPVGVGIGEPVIATPRNLDEAKTNMRVEFRIVRVPAEAVKSSDFDY